MPEKPLDDGSPRDAIEVAAQLVARLDAESCDYALGGALALGYWSTPRATLDVDVMLFLPASEPTACLRLLQRLGCDFRAAGAQASLVTHGYCQVKFLEMRVDVFVPLIEFHETARLRRRQVPLGGRTAWIWDAESLCVFKVMFFRPKDLTDLRSLLKYQGAALDREWVEGQLLSMYGPRDPRIASWRELCADVPAT